MFSFLFLPFVLVKPRVLKGVKDNQGNQDRSREGSIVYERSAEILGNRLSERLGEM